MMVLPFATVGGLVGWLTPGGHRRWRRDAQSPDEEDFGQATGSTPPQH
jgi:hypothetical protein